MKPITNMEKKILEMISNGFSTREVAVTLTISKHTVESHRKSLLQKFDAKNSAELVKKAIQNKTIPQTLNIEKINPYENNEPY
jgi:DNA-binding CsgD family transcriptional regulator